MNRLIIIIIFFYLVGRSKPGPGPGPGPRAGHLRSPFKKSSGILNDLQQKKNLIYLEISPHEIKINPRQISIAVVLLLNFSIKLLNELVFLKRYSLSRLLYFILVYFFMERLSNYEQPSQQMDICSTHDRFNNYQVGLLIQETTRESFRILLNVTNKNFNI